MLDTQIEAIPLFQKVLHDGACSPLEPQLVNKSLIFAALLYKGILLQEISYVTLEPEGILELRTPWGLLNPGNSCVEIEAFGAGNRVLQVERLLGWQEPSRGSIPSTT